MKQPKNNETTADGKNQINTYFITRLAYMSVELNAHNLLYLVLLVKQRQLYKQVLVNVHLFNSQACESISKDARSLSGRFSTRRNFTMKSFIQRSQKLCILNQMKYYRAENDLSFPVHHKHERELELLSSHELDEIYSMDIEQLISNAYDQARHIPQHSKIFDTLRRCDINCLNDLNVYVFNILKKNSRMINYSLPYANNIDDWFGLDEENDDNTVENYVQDQSIDEIQSGLQNDPASDEEEEDILSSTKSDFHGIRIVDNVNPDYRQSVM